MLAHGHGVARAGVRVERVARVRSADVRADRAVQARWVGCVVSEPVAILEHRDVALGGQYERGAARPASNQLGGDPDAAIEPLVVGRVMGEAPEGGHVLLELAQHEVAAVPAEVASAAALHVAKTLRLSPSSVVPVDSAAQGIACPTSSPPCTADVVLTVGADLANK